MKAFPKIITGIVFLTVFNSVALGWGKTGHRVTAQIAEHYLNEPANNAIQEILGHESLAESSTWADFMRQNPDPFWQKEAGPYHYVTIPEGSTYKKTGAPEQGDAITALEKFSAQLKNPETSLKQRQLALRFIVHVIGDLHQPLHVGNGTDQGGNAVRISFFGELTNLHAIWDSQLIDREQLSYTEWTAWLLPKISESDRRAWWETDPLVWVGESAAIRKGIYPENQVLSWDYPYQHIATVKNRLQMGGVRLAAYLNELFSS